MPRSVDVSGLVGPVLQYAVAGFTVGFLLWSVLLVWQVLFGEFDVFRSEVLLVTLSTAWLVLTVGWVRWARRQDGGGSMWAPIPRSQYTGRLAGAGGLARWEWERSLPGTDDEED